MTATPEAATAEGQPDETVVGRTWRTGPVALPPLTAQTTGIRTAEGLEEVARETAPPRQQATMTRGPNEPLDFFTGIDWEEVLGRNWLAIIGIVTLVLGIGFFLKLSFDNNWVSDTGRIFLGVAAGLGLVIGGEYAQRRVPVWAQAVTAGGAATLYLSIYAAFGLYELIRPDVAFLLLAVVVAGAGLLALRYDSIVIGLLGIVGAFIAPALLGHGLPHISLVLVYILVVDLGILWVSTLRNWRWFVLLGWIGSYGVFALGVTQFPDVEPLLVQAGLTGIFLIFAGATTLFHIIYRKAARQFDMSLVAVNATAFFGLTLGILEDYDEWFGLIAFGMFFFYGLTTYATVRRQGVPPALTLTTLSISLVFLTIAFPLQLSGVWVTTAWAAQGMALIWTGFLLRRWPTRAFGLTVLGWSIVSLLLVDLTPTSGDLVPVLNRRFLIIAFVVAALASSGYAYWRYGARVKQWETHVLKALSLFANLLTLGALSNYLKMARRHCRRNHRSAHASCNTPR